MDNAGLDPIELPGLVLDHQHPRPLPFGIGAQGFLEDLLGDRLCLALHTGPKALVARPGLGRIHGRAEVRLDASGTQTCEQWSKV